MTKNCFYCFALGAVVLSMVAFTACSNTSKKVQQDGSKTELPANAVEIDYQHHIYCDVLLRDSIPARMIFDTGCSNILLDSTFYADTFGKSGALRKAMVGGAGNGKELVNLDTNKWSYSIGEESKTEDMAMVVNLRRIVGDRADGMFGMVFMQGKRVEFNYADGWMRFLPAEEKIGDDFTRIQCKWLDKEMRIVIPLSLQLDNGYVFEGNFLIDTGMAGTVSLNSTTAQNLQKQQHLANARCMIYAVGGIGGSREDYVFKSPQISLGNNVIKDVRVVWAGNNQGAMADMRYDGLIGNELLDRFDVIFDFVNCAVYLRPNRNFNRAEPNDFGIAMTPKVDHWIVNGLLEGGNAEQAGLRRGDRIETINGIRANDSKISDLYPLPDKITLTIRRGGDYVDVTISKE